MAISSTSTTFVSGVGEIIGEVTAISFGGISATAIDTTLLSSTTKSYVLGTTDGGTVEITCNMINTVPTMPVSGDAVSTNYTVRFGATGPVVTFSGYISGTSFEASIDSQVITTYTIRITGAVTVAAGS